MLVDILLLPEDVYMVQRRANGDTVLTVPLDVLTRAIAAQRHLQPAQQAKPERLHG